MVIDALIQFILGVTFNQTWKNRERVIQYIRQNAQKLALWRRFSVPKLGLVNRERELQAIQSAIAESQRSRIILLIGMGGLCLPSSGQLTHGCPPTDVDS